MYATHYLNIFNDDGDITGRVGMTKWEGDYTYIEGISYEELEKLLGDEIENVEYDPINNETIVPSELVDYQTRQDYVCRDLEDGEVWWFNYHFESFYRDVEDMYPVFINYTITEEFWVSN